MKFTAAAAVAAMVASANALAIPEPSKDAKQFANSLHTQAAQFAVAHQNDAAYQYPYVPQGYCNSNFQPSGSSYVCGGYERAYAGWLCTQGLLQFCGGSGTDCNPYAQRPGIWQDPSYYQSIQQCYNNPINCYGAQQIDPYTNCVNPGGIQTCSFDDNGNQVCVA